MLHRSFYFVLKKLNLQKKKKKDLALKNELIEFDFTDHKKKRATEKNLLFLLMESAFKNENYFNTRGKAFMQHKYGVEF